MNELGLVIMEIPPNCKECHCKEYVFGGKLTCFFTRRGIKKFCATETKPNYCPVNKAVAYIEPDGHIVYLRENKS